MHILQEKILSAADDTGLLKFASLRNLAEIVGEKSPQKIKHHLEQLQKKGYINFDKNAKEIKRLDVSNIVDNILVSVPFMGKVNCGVASIYADNEPDSYIKISKKLLPRGNKIFLLQAEGDSMNKANINGKTIDSGDLVVVDGEVHNPVPDQYIVSIIDGMANVKKYTEDKENNTIVLQSESTQKHWPIYIHMEDRHSYHVSGRVVDVIKR